MEYDAVTEWTYALLSPLCGQLPFGKILAWPSTFIQLLFVTSQRSDWQQLGDGGALNAIKNQRLAKYQICISASKVWDTRALFEFFSLKFRYPSDGSLLLYIDYGGYRDTPIPTDHAHKLKEFLRTHPHNYYTSYTHCFLSGTDRRPLDEHTVPGLRKSIRQAEQELDSRMSAWSGRIAEITSVDASLLVVLFVRCSN